MVAGVQYCQTHCNAGKAKVDTEGKVTQSAMVIFGKNMETGAVSNIYDVEDAVAVAKDVLIYTDHAILVGEAATRFAMQQNYSLVNYSNTTNAATQYADWKNGGCTQNWWRNVHNGEGCTLIDGYYDRDTESSIGDITGWDIYVLYQYVYIYIWLYHCFVFISGCDGNETGKYEAKSKDNLQGLVTGSIAILAIDKSGHMSLATNSNGLDFEIAGRVSDAAIPGAGGYINPAYGGCTATGHGDIIIRFSPAKHAVTLMSMGLSPQEAAEGAVQEVAEWCGDKQLIVLCLSPQGEPGIAANEATNPTYAYRTNRCPEGAVIADIANPRGTCT